MSPGIISDMSTARRILIVEDDAHIADLLRMHLADEGYEVEHAADGESGAAQLERGTWDALVLDLMLPGVDGLEICRRARAMARYTPIIITSARSSEVHRILGLELGADDYLAKPFSLCKKIRQRSMVPIIFLTARSDEIDRVLGLELGGDDYVSKPFSPRELVARVRALLRRSEALARNARLDAGTLEADGLSIDPLARELRIDGRPVDLTPREFDLLYFFARHPGKVFSRLDLLNQVWGYRHDGYEHTVNTHINRLRLKVETDPANPRRIRTVWGRGYKFGHTGESDT